jgi:hypothetical protein
MYYDPSDNQPDPAFNEIGRAAQYLANLKKLPLLGLNLPVDWAHLR